MTASFPSSETQAASDTAPADAVPVALMAVHLAHSEVDFEDEDACVLCLMDRGHLAIDIHDGLDEAVERARTLRGPALSPDIVVRDMAAVAACVAALAAPLLTMI